MAGKKKVSKKKTAKKKPLSGKIRKDLFPLEYIKDFNATRAAEAVGYSKRTARQAGARLLSDANIQKEIERLIAERSERTKIDADFVLTTLGNWIHADPCDIIDETTGSYKRIHDWPVVWRQMLSAADVREIFEMQGTGNERSREKIGEIIKYKFIDKVRTLELIGRHVDVQAFNERFEHSGKVDHNYTVEFVEPGQEEKPCPT